MEPGLGQELGRIVRLSPAEAGVALIDKAQQRLMATAPELAWEKVSVVQKWLQEAAEAV
jgi:hypothetical protein